MVTLDLADAASLPNLAAQVEAEIGPVDVMVHCGGITSARRPSDVLDVDRRVVIDAERLPSPRRSCSMVKRAKDILSMTSLMGCSLSFAVRLLRGQTRLLAFEALRAEHHDDGLKVTMVCPGFIRTNISLNAVVGDGSQQGTMDAKTGAGMTAEQCAERMVKAVERNKAEVLIGRYEILAAFIKRLSPALLRRIVRRAAVT